MLGVPRPLQRGPPSGDPVARRRLRVEEAGHGAPQHHRLLPPIHLQGGEEDLLLTGTLTSSCGIAKCSLTDVNLIV